MIHEENLVGNILHGRESDAAIKGAKVDCVDVSYSVMIHDKPKRLLKNCNFGLDPGDLCALMGPSGAGKSTLLDILADRKQTGSWSGDVFINDQPRSRLFAKEIAYVLQDDIHISTLSVEETLQYAAWTRMDQACTDKERQDRVNDLLHMMGLEHVRKSYVGDPMKKGISGGQMKRLSIAVEIVPMPHLIFLDEPTSGLDSSIALEVMSAVKQLTASSRTCITTIHQPSPEVFALFDKLVLLSAGRIIYYGAAREAALHFTQPNVGYYYDGLRNPAEFIIEVSCGQLLPKGSKVAKQPEELEVLYKCSKYYQPVSIASRAAIRASGAENAKSDDTHIQLHATDKWTAFKMLVHRTWTAKIRDTDDLKAQLAKNIVVGLLVGVLFYGQGDVNSPLFSAGVPNSEVSNCSAILFMAMMYTMVGNTQAIPYLSSAIVIYRRELNSNAYAAAPFWAAQMITTLPLNFGYHFVYVLCLFFMVQLPSSGAYFFYFLFILFFANVCAYYSAMWLAAFTNNEQLAFALFPMGFLFLSTFSGFPISVDDVPSIWIWAPYVSYSRWIFEGLMVNQWDRYDTDDATGQQENGNGDVLDEYGFSGYDKDDSFWIALLYVIFFAGITYSALRPPKSHLVKVDNAKDLMSMVSRGPSMIGSLASASLSVVAGVPVPAGSGGGGASSSSRKGGGRSMSRKKSNDLGVSLLTSFTGGTPEQYDDDAIPDDELIVHQPPASVDMYRQSTGAVDMAKGCRLLFRNVNYTVTSRADGVTKIKLLTDVTGWANPGEMVALMGASGAGKSTLLDVVAQRKNQGVIDGSITYNGSPEMTSYSYVMQDNVHIGILTVRESIYYAAELRLNEKMSQDAKHKRVEKVIDMLGLTAVADTVLGTPEIRGVSGGQLKRVSIGVELVNMPDLIFLDEPTTGLDSSISFEVMAAVRNLANQNRTVVATIHQPSPDTFALFDTLLLLAAGRVIYFGAISEMVDFFQGSPYAFPYKAGSNTADYVVAVAGGFIPASDGTVISGAELADYYRSTDKARQAESMTPVPTAPDMRTSSIPHNPFLNTGSPQMRDPLEDEESPGHYNTSTYYQIKTLVSRKLLCTRKDSKAIRVTIARHIIVALFYGSIYWQLSDGTDPTSYSDRLSVFFFSLMFVVLGHMQSVPALMEDRLVFYRERGAKAYGAFSYWISTWVVQIPLAFVCCLLFSAVIYPMVGLRANTDAFGFFFYFMFTTSFCGMFAGYFVASLAPSTQAALSYYPMVLFFQLCFAGYLVYLPQFPDWLGEWAPYISFMRYTFQGLTLNEFQDNGNLPNSHEYIVNLGFDTISIAGCAAIMPLWIGICAAAFLTGLKYIDYEER